MMLMLLGIGWGNIEAPVSGEEGMALFIDVLDSDVLANYATAGDSEAPIDPTIVRSRLVNINWDILAMTGYPPESEIVGGDVLLLNLFEDSSFTANLDHWEVRSGNNFTWIGHIEGAEDSQLTLVVEDGVLVGNIRVSGESYQVRYMGEGVHVIREIDERFFPPEGEPIPDDNPSQANEPLLSSAEVQGDTAADDGSTLDVMVVYTPAARLAEGGTTAMKALINLAIVETNTAYSNSGVTPRVRLVHTEEINYTEVDFEPDVQALQNASDGIMDNVHTLRDVHGADMVSLVVEDSDFNACGIGFVNSSLSAVQPFSVIDHRCLAIFVLAHEMGHNMGLQHDRANQPLDGVFPYSHGYVDILNNFRTIMGTGSTTRIQHFSNPAVSFEGNPTGVDFQADAARSLNNTAFTVANWRESTFSDLVIEGLGLSSSSVAPGGSITVSYNIANRETKTVTENYTEKVYLSTNNTLDGTDVLLATSILHTTDLPLNATLANSRSVTIPTGTTLGSYFILVEADALAVVAESDENNNVTASPFTVAGLLTVNKAGSGSGTVVSSPAGINCGSGCSESFTEGTIVTLTATPAAGSVFGGWSSGGCSGTGICMLTINANTSVTATFNASDQKFTLEVTTRGSAKGTVTSGPAGINCGSDCSQVYAINTSVVLTAAPMPGASFKQWSGACTGIGTCTVTMSEDRSVTATYSKTFTDDPLTSQVTPVKAVHITELREAVNTLRLNNGRSAFAYTDSTLTAGVTQARRVHITDLRTALNAVYDALGRTRPTYTDPTIVARQTVIKKAQIAQIRSAVRAVESLSVN